jgi:hypothetical protein
LWGQKHQSGHIHILHCQCEDWTSQITITTVTVLWGPALT